ncbi:MAG: flagellar protein [Lachnospiraceae bacterium]|nr:flagellar protein [Lachnospiraceae bacterium]
MKISNGSYPSIEEMTGRYLSGVQGRQRQSGDVSEKSFAEILNQKQTGGPEESVRFSKHAAKRLSDRNISLSSSQLNRLNEGINKAGAKGISDSLVMVDNLAFIVNTGSNTVVTAMDAREMENNVFSNIDGAVIA